MMENEISDLAKALNEAVMERNLAKARLLIRDRSSKIAAVALVLESMCHLDRTADNADWCWFAEQIWRNEEPICKGPLDKDGYCIKD